MKSTLIFLSTVENHEIHANSATRNDGRFLTVDTLIIAQFTIVNILISVKFNFTSISIFEFSDWTIIDCRWSI